MWVCVLYSSQFLTFLHVQWLLFKLAVVKFMKTVSIALTKYLRAINIKKGMFISAYGLGPELVGLLFWN